MALASATFAEILDDLSSRFIINVPEEELASVERICFQIEQAHWFYEDFHCPLLHQWSHEHEKAFADFMQYKIRVPVCGAIMLNDTMEKCVLVKGWSSRSGWGFPKGKINKDEPDSTCAAREVLEETGYDISPLIKEQDYVELTIREQRIRLYIVVGVPEDTEFCPKTRKEISKIEWHKVADLPTWIKSRDRDTPYHCGGGCVKYGSSRFYMVVPFVSKLRHWLKMQRKIARKKASDTSNQEESTELVIFNGHAATSSVKETSPETSVPGTESEGSPHEQSPSIGAQLNQFSPQLIDSQNILKSILGLNRSTSTQPTNHPISMSQEELVQQSITSSMQVKQVHSYFSAGLPIEQQPVQMKHSVVDVHSTTVLPYRNLQTPNSIYLEELNVNHSQKNSLKGISRSNSQTPIQNKHNHDITAPIPIHANTNVAIAALDPEQKLRRNSLLSLFAASTSTRPSGSDIPVPITVEYDTQRRNSLLNVLQPETSVITPSKNLTHDDIVQHQLQQSKAQYFPDYDPIKSSNDHIRNDTIFNTFQSHINQNIPQNDNPAIMNPLSETILNSTFMRERDPAYNENSSHGVVTPKISSSIGHIGQGRPSNNNDNSNGENHEVARKMSLLGLFSTVSNSGNGSSITPVNHIFSNASTLLRANHESLLRLIKSSPSPQSKPPASSIVNNTSTLSQDYGCDVDGKNNSFIDDCIRNNYTRNNIDSHKDRHVPIDYDSNNHFDVSPDLRVRYELLDRIHTFIPSGGTKSQENNLCYVDKNPMISFKFDVEKIVAAL